MRPVNTEMGWNPEIRFLVSWTRYRHAMMRGDARRVTAARALAERAVRLADDAEHPLAYGHTAALSMQMAWADAGFALMCDDTELSESHANRSLGIVEHVLRSRDEHSLRSWAMTGYGALLVGIRREQGRLGELLPLTQDTGTTVPAWRSAVAAIRLAAGDTSGARDALEPLARDGWAGLVPDQTSTGVLHLIAESHAALTQREMKELAERIAPFTDRFSCAGAYSLGPLSLAAAELADALGRDDAERLRTDGEQRWRAFRAELAAGGS